MSKLWMATLLTVSLFFSQAAHAVRIGVFSDSVVAGTMKYVQPLMPCVERIPHDAEDTGHALAALDAWFFGKQFDVIYVNIGQWDLARRTWPPGKVNGVLDPTLTAPPVTPRAEFSANMQKLMIELHRLEPNAVIIYGTITEVPVGSIGRRASDVAAYNDIAINAVKKWGGEIDMLRAFMLPYSYLHSDVGGNMVHYTSAGRQIMASHLIDVFQAHGGC